MNKMLIKYIRTWIGKKEVQICLVGIIFLPIITYQISIEFNGTKKNIKYHLFKSAIDTLLKQGVDTVSLFTLINDYRTHFEERYIRINIIGRTLISPNLKQEPIPLKVVAKFINNNFDILDKAERIYGIPKGIIALILWVESRFGSNTGNHHIPSVFFSIAAGNDLLQNSNEFRSHFDMASNKDSLNSDILKRAKSKQDFAFKELKALVEIQSRKILDVTNLFGSYSGAFGIPQFLPSSYLIYGADGNGDGHVDLFNLDDAIFSVANFLKQNGFRKEDANTYFKALFAYNKSSAYVLEILEAYKKLSSGGY
jgi:membrane-bound lytic murein transglycosylase B